MTRSIPDIISSLIDIFVPSIKLFCLNDNELLRTFNCGIGMAVIVDKKYLSKAHSVLKQHKTSYKIIGQVVRKPSDSKIIYVD